MTIDRQSAEEIVALFTKADTLCNDALKTIKRDESLGQVKVFGCLAAHFMGNSYLNILAPIWKAFPDLEPAEMKEPYVEPRPVLTPESQAALSVFLVAARAAIEHTAQMTSGSEKENLFCFGGLSEVEQKVAAIEEFQKFPRFRDDVSDK